MDTDNYCAHCGTKIPLIDKENGVYVNLLMVKLFCEGCGKPTFIRWEDRKRE